MQSENHPVYQHSIISERRGDKQPVLEASDIHCARHSSSVVITILSQYGFEENSAEKVFTFTQVICQLITNLHSCNNISKVIEEFKSNKKKGTLAFIIKLETKLLRQSYLENV